MTESKEIAAFAEVARRFCTFCETKCPLSPEELMELAKLLAELNRAALDLPDALDEGDGRAEDGVQGLPPHTWSAPFDLYWDILDPLLINPDEPVAHSLGEDMSDIYLDLKKGFAQYDRGHPAAAAWTWRFYFWSHWGAHLVGAQRALHFCFSSAYSDEG